MDCLKITSISWGEIAIDSKSLPKAKDAKLYPGGGVKEWDWNETGTRHRPGIQTGDAQELIQAGAVEIVLSRGMHLKLGVPDETVQWLEGQGGLHQGSASHPGRCRKLILSYQHDKRQKCVN